MLNILTFVLQICIICVIVIIVIVIIIKLFLSKMSHYCHPTSPCTYVQQKSADTFSKFSMTTSPLSTYISLSLLFMLLFYSVCQCPLHMTLVQVYSVIATWLCCSLTFQHLRRKNLLISYKTAVNLIFVCACECVFFVLFFKNIFCVLIVIEKHSYSNYIPAQGSVVKKACILYNRQNAVKNADAKLSIYLKSHYTEVLILGKSANSASVFSMVFVTRGQRIR